MSRILLWSPNYAPELTGIPPLVTDAAEWLAARGHAVDVVTAMPNYPSRRIDPAYRGVLWLSERRVDVGVHRALAGRPDADGVRHPLPEPVEVADDREHRFRVGRHAPLCFELRHAHPVPDHGDRHATGCAPVGVTCR
jgi:hypothetical protein